MCNFGSNFCFQYSFKMHSISEVHMSSSQMLLLELSCACFLPSEKEPSVPGCGHRSLHQDQQLCRWAWPGGRDTADPNHSHLTVSPGCWAGPWLAHTREGTSGGRSWWGSDVSDVCVKRFSPWRWRILLWVPVNLHADLETSSLGCDTRL